MAIYSNEEDPNITQGVQIRYSESEFIKFFESLVMKRFGTIGAINKFIHNELGFNPELEESQGDEDFEEADNRLVSNCTVNREDLCYLDIYYLLDNKKQLYITEVGYDFST